ncbi:MAG: hypothetical protein GVY10_10035 [Verrucomicrobia bacterium]|jgi:probable HAF family extracellular repeat protein|nr:hypothetical protein [Verrucomicrobiota bacterium]
MALHRCSVRGGGVVLGAALLPLWSAAGTLQLLGDLPGGRVQSSAAGLTADGAIVVGTTETLTTDGSDATTRAAYWTEATGWVPLPFTDETYERTQARDVSDDGAVIVGEGENFSFGRDEAAVWTRQPDGGYKVQLLTPAGDSKFGFFATVNMTANAVSGDGTLVTGHGQTNEAKEPYEAFYWTEETGISPMGNLSNGPIPEAQFKPSYSSGRAVDRDGSRIAGMSWSGLRPGGSAAPEAFTYNLDTESMTGLGDLQDPVFNSTAEGISKDGAVVVGQARNEAGEQVAFLWTAAGGMVDLGDLPGGETVATAEAVNADGSVIVGTARTERGSEAFLWTEATGMGRLQDVAGIEAAMLGSGWLETAVAISDDGLTVAGTYRSDASNRPQRQAYLVRLSGAELAPPPDLAAIAATVDPRLEQLTPGKLRLRFTRQPSEPVSYQLQKTGDLAKAFENVIFYEADGRGGYERTVLEAAIDPDPAGSTPAEAVETIPMNGRASFWRLSVRP